MRALTIILLIGLLFVVLLTIYYFAMLFFDMFIEPKVYDKYRDWGCKVKEDSPKWYKFFTKFFLLD